MSSSIVARRGALTALTVFAAAALFFIGLAQGSASAAEVKGSATITISSGKVGKAFAIKPAKGKRVGKKGIRATAPARSLTVGSTAKAGLAGGIKLTNGKRSVKITKLSLSVSKSLTVVRGKLGKKNLVIFTANGKAKLDRTAKSVKLSGGKLVIPRSVAKQVKKLLRLKKAPSGRIGSLGINAWVKEGTPVDPCVENPDADGCQPVNPCEVDPNAEGCQPVITDPYLAQCNVAATSKVTGDLPVATLPTLSSPKAITGVSTVSWGIKQSFRNYAVVHSSGSLHAQDGATLTGTSPYTSVNDSVSWTFVDGEYSDNGTPNNVADDKAVLNLSGTTVFCATGHNFRVAVSDPTVVINGENSKIVADVDTNLAGVWTESQRVDLASLDLDGEGAAAAVLSESNGAEWTDVPAAFTETGGQAVCGVSDPRCNYTTGTVMDSISVEAPADGLVDQYNAQCGVAATSRQVDSWDAAAALPTLTDPVDTTSPTTVDWGFFSSFRSYVTRTAPSGSLQAIDGAGHDSSLDSGTHMVPPLPHGFTFPVDEGSYAANDPVDTSDDQTVIKGTGTALFCKQGHGFWVSVSNPTIVIDGDDSRIVADISSNQSGVWKTEQKVDFATLDLDGIAPTYNESGTSITWGSIPAKLNVDFATYPAGQNIDPVSVSVSTAEKTDFPQEAFCSVTQTSTIAAFPVSIGSPATFNVGSATASAVSASELDWGVRQGMRGSNPYNPIVVTTSGDVTPSNPSDMTGAGKFFGWTGSSGSYYSDGRLVVPLEGQVGLCSQSHGYGTVISNPKVVIDGANSRIVADVAARVGVDWLRSTVDFVKFDASAITPATTPVSGATEYSWTVPDGGVTLTAAGASVIGVLGGTYIEGAAFQGFTVKATVPSS